MTGRTRSLQGCFACKERKVKCDEQKPSCKRCQGLKRECPGYMDVWDTMHREENAHTARLVDIRVKKRLRERRAENASLSLLPRPVGFEINTYALNRFFRDYSVNSGIAFLDVLPSICSKSPDSCFLDAIYATALASASRQLEQSRLMVQARRRYGKAIVGANKALQDPAAGNSDSLLAALFLLGLFEAIVARPLPYQHVNTEVTCHPHSRGALSFLRYRSRMGMDSQIDRMVFTFFSHIALMEYFMSPPGFTPLWSELNRFKTRWAQGPQIEPLIRLAVELKSEIELSLSQQDLTTESLSDLSDRCLKIVEDLQIASEIRLPPDGLLAGPTFNGLFSLCNMVTVAMASCLYQTVRQHMIELMLSLGIAAGEHSLGTDAVTALSERGLENLDQICKQIRNVFEFDELGAIGQDTPGHSLRIWCMIWPIAAVMSSCLADLPTKIWAHDKLYRIGKATGFGLAMALTI